MFGDRGFILFLCSDCKSFIPLIITSVLLVLSLSANACNSSASDLVNLISRRTFLGLELLGLPVRGLIQSPLFRPYNKLYNCTGNLSSVFIKFSKNKHFFSYQNGKSESSISIGLSFPNVSFELC